MDTRYFFMKLIDNKEKEVKATKNEYDRLAKKGELMGIYQAYIAYLKSEI